MKRVYRLLVVLAICGLCSGCTINYNLEIKENEISENIIVNDTFINSRTSSDILNNYNSWMPVYDNIQNPDLIRDSDDDGGKIVGVEYHEKKITSINNGYYYTYKYIYPINRFSHANSLRLAFGKPSFYDGGSYINIKTNSENALCNYDYFESLQVNIKIDQDVYKVNQTNAHSINGNTYTWNLNRNNCNDSVISLTLDKTIKTESDDNPNPSDNDNKQNSNNNRDSYAMYIFLGIIIIIIIIGYILFNKMKVKGNSMDD